MAKCYTCDGSGDCSRCNGTGEDPGFISTLNNDIFEVKLDCDACGGSGECSDCDGTGELDDDSDDE